MSYIWVPKFKIIEPKSALVVGRTEMEGWWRLKAVRPNGDVRLDTGWFPNIITNSGLDAIGTSTTYLNECRVGTGNTAPSALDTSLQTQVGTTTSIQNTSVTAQSTEPYYGAYTRTYRFAAGVATGNIAEIGVGVPAGALFSRALILDGGGSPTTITVLADEFLDATYQLRMKPPLNDVLGTINISGVNYDTVTRAANVTNSTSWGLPSMGGGSQGSNYTFHTGTLGAITTLPSGSHYFSNASSQGVYSPGSYSRDFGDTVGLDSGNNVGGIRTIAYELGSNATQHMGHMQTQFTPTIPKDNTKVFTFVCRHIWARGTP